VFSVGEAVALEAIQMLMTDEKSIVSLRIIVNYAREVGEAITHKADYEQNSE
jgi:hypothetical protein